MGGSNSFPPAGYTESQGFGLGSGGGPGGGFPAAAGAVPVPGQPGGGIIPRNLMLFPPWERPIPGHAEFNTLGQKSTVAVEANIELPGAGFQIPPNNVARVTGVIFYVNNLLATSNITFNVLVNGAPVQGYNNVLIMPRVAASVSNQFDAYIDVPSGARLQVFYTNSDGGSYQVGAGLSGFYWPEVAGKNWMNFGAGV